jgi:hypothetical protein
VVVLLFRGPLTNLSFRTGFLKEEDGRPIASYARNCNHVYVSYPSSIFISFLFPCRFVIKFSQSLSVPQLRSSPKHVFWKIRTSLFDSCNWLDSIPCFLLQKLCYHLDGGGLSGRSSRLDILDFFALIRSESLVVEKIVPLLHRPSASIRPREQSVQVPIS